MYEVYVKNNKIHFCNITDIIRKLQENRIIVYPTESVFGLGCNPDSESAVESLLLLKNRSWKKGLILVAANYKQLVNYIDDSCLSNMQLSRAFSTWPGPVTWVFPSHVNSPYWITGKFRSVAVRVSKFKPIQKICLLFGKPIVSTSANLAGNTPARTVQEVCNQFKNCNYDDLSIMIGNVFGYSRPSNIRDIITGNFFRK